MFVRLKLNNNLNNHRIIVDNSVLSEEDCRFAINLVDSFYTRNEMYPFKDNPRVLVAPEEENVIGILKKYSDIVNELHRKNNGFVPALYTVEAFLSLWKTDTYTGVHIDSHQGYEFLQFSTVMYLNDDYEGGEIFFPNQNFSYKPKAGDVVMFPCGGTEYQHGVNKVTSGKRYTIAMWHSERPDRKFSKIY